MGIDCSAKIVKAGEKRVKVIRRYMCVIKSGLPQEKMFATTAFACLPNEAQSFGSHSNLFDLFVDQNASCGTCNKVQQQLCLAA